MDKLLLQKLIVSHRERFLADRGLVRREVLDQMLPLVHQREVLFFSGIRRCGKSSLMSVLARDLMQSEAIDPNRILFINFEDERLVRFTVEDFDQLYQVWLELDYPTGRKFLFLDEIQVIPFWERWVHRMYEFEDVKIMITGSNASLTQSDLSTALTGRNREIRVHPFSFTEFLRMRNIAIPKGAEVLHPDILIPIKRGFTEYCNLGGFPEIVRNGEVMLADSYFKDIIHRDVISRFQIRNPREIRELCLYLITNSGSLLSLDSLRRVLSVKSVSTVRNYLEILKDVYLIHALPLYDFSVKRQIYNPPKYYVADLGFYQSLGFRFSENLGAVLENVVLQHLIRVHDEVYYWTSKTGREVDFLVRKNRDITEAIQVTYSLTTENRDRELSGLIAAAKELQVNNLKVLTYDEEDLIRQDGLEIRVLPVWKWMITRK